MSDKHWVEKRQKLRIQAEQIVPGLQAEEMIHRPAEVLLHELLVHKVELEMQIQELRSHESTIDEARSRYLELFDATPVAFITLNADERISNLNLAAARLLEADRASLIECPFVSFIVEKDKDRWRAFCSKNYDALSIGPSSIRLKMLGASGKSFEVQIDQHWTEFSSDFPLLRLVIFDLARFQFDID